MSFRQPRTAVGAWRLLIFGAVVGAACGSDPAATPGGATGSGGGSGTMPDGSAGGPVVPHDSAPPPPTDVRVDPSCPAGAFFCDGFESGSDFDMTKWELNGDTPPARRHFEVDDTVAYDGTRSLHMHFGQGTGEGSLLIATRNPLTAPNDTLNIRFYFLFGDVTYPGFHPIYASIVEKDKFSVFSTPVLGFGTIRQKPALEIIGNMLDNALSWQNPNLQAQRWTCAELRFFGGTGPAYDDEDARVFIDGVEIPDMHGTDAAWFHPSVARWSPKYDGSFLRFGNASLGPTDTDPRVDLWIDALVVSNSPVGCM